MLSWKVEEVTLKLIRIILQNISNLYNREATPLEYAIIIFPNNMLK